MFLNYITFFLKYQGQGSLALQPQSFSASLGREGELRYVSEKCLFCNEYRKVEKKILDYLPGAWEFS